MARRLKLLSGLSTLAAAGAIGLCACGGEGEGAQRAMGGAQLDEGAAGGEGEAAAAADAATNRVMYLAALMTIRGHLDAGAELYAAGEATSAAAHMQHPQAEVYKRLEPAFKNYGAKGFEAELTALAEEVAAGAAAETVEAHLKSARAAVARAMSAARPSAKDLMLAAAEVLRAAGGEFDQGVKGGKVVNVYEYQDAHGFVASAADALAAVKAQNDATEAALKLARDQAAIALSAAPTAVAPESIDATSARIYGAAARIEIAALGLD